MDKLEVTNLVINIINAITPIIMIICTVLIYKWNKENTKRMHEMNNEKTALDGLRNQLSTLLTISVEYPELEDDIECARWDGNYCGDTKKLRYYNYCCMVFNFLSDVYKYRENEKTIIDEREYIKTHRMWWKKEIHEKAFEDIDSYGKGFIEHVNNIIKEIEKYIKEVEK